MEEVAGGSAEPIRASGQEDIAGPCVVQGPLELGACTDAGGLVDEEPVGAGCLQVVDLERFVLVGGRDSRMRRTLRTGRR